MSSAFFDGLEDVPLVTRSYKPEQPKTFACQSCAGTGLYRGTRIHQADSKCFACNGKGHFNKPYGDVMRERQNRKQGKIDAQIDRQQAFEEQNPGLIAWMAANSSGSSFIADMHRTVMDRGALSEKQLAAVVRSKASSDERKTARAAERVASAPKVDLSQIHVMFDKARENGLKRLAYRAEGMILTPAKAGSANAGGIYVKSSGGTYLGKVMGSAFMQSRDATDAHKNTLATIAANPSDVAKAYGKRTGSCSCCGRELTDPTSIEAGIGPICATKWGL